MKGRGNPENRPTRARLLEGTDSGQQRSENAVINLFFFLQFFFFFFFFFTFPLSRNRVVRKRPGEMPGEKVIGFFVSFFFFFFFFLNSFFSFPCSRFPSDFFCEIVLPFGFNLL